MRIQQTAHGATLWLSANDTYLWSRGAHPRAGNGRWPCSQLAGKRLVASFNSGGLYDLAINGRRFDCDAGEFNAITSDFLALKLSRDNPAWFAAVGQFKRKDTTP